MSNDPPPSAETAIQSGNSSKSAYPRPEAEYSEVVQNPECFSQKLQAFHASCGTKFKVPTVGRKALDLHHLFVEVTSRGGIEKVVRDRKWKDVIGAFNLPSTITSASFVLRKYYMSLLYHFEQVYYFRKEEPTVSVADSDGGNPSETAAHSIEDDTQNVKQFPVSPVLESGCSITGTIDAKFDYGYIISVDLGSEKLTGVLYHTTTIPHLSQSLQASRLLTRRKKKKHLLALRDPFKPKPNRSGYNFFFAEHYTKLKPLYHGQERAISKRIGLLWNRLSEAEKQVYQDKGTRDRERYKTELSEYKSSHHPQAS